MCRSTNRTEGQQDRRLSPPRVTASVPSSAALWHGSARVQPSLSHLGLHPRFLCFPESLTIHKYTGATRDWTPSTAPAASPPRGSGRAGAGSKAIAGGVRAGTRLHPVSGRAGGRMCRWAATGRRAAGRWAAAPRNAALCHRAAGPVAPTATSKAEKPEPTSVGLLKPAAGPSQAAPWAPWGLAGLWGAAQSPRPHSAAQRWSIRCGRAPGAGQGHPGELVFSARRSLAGLTPAERATEAGSSRRRQQPSFPWLYSEKKATWK